jgi:hypothetical protein
VVKCRHRSGDCQACDDGGILGFQDVSLNQRTWQ